MPLELGLLHEAPPTEFAPELEILGVHVFVVDGVGLLFEDFVAAVNHALELDVEPVGGGVVHIQGLYVLEEVLLPQFLQSFVAQLHDVRV